MKFYYVYILLCSDNTYYTGMTNDLERRINLDIKKIVILFPDDLLNLNGI